ncbi:MAG: hypothetical protein ACK5E6_10295 [Cyanobacteriota bacterium]
MSAPFPGSPPPGPSGDRLFNNADSFAQAFDAAWQQHSRGDEGGLSQPEKLERILDDLADHPFCLHDRAMARQVGEFRIRLLGL